MFLHAVAIPLINASKTSGLGPERCRAQVLGASVAAFPVCRWKTFGQSQTPDAPVFS